MNHLDQLKLLVDQNRCKAHGGFVHQKYFGVREKGPCHSQHLLLASAQRDPKLITTLPQSRKEFKHVIHVPLNLNAVVSEISSHLQVLSNGQSRENPSVFRNNGNAL